MDDHSRFIVGYGLHASQSTALVMEVVRGRHHLLRALLKEILTDNGSQYVTLQRGTSVFNKELTQTRHPPPVIVARPRHPANARQDRTVLGHALGASAWPGRRRLPRPRRRPARIGLFIDHHNFQRPPSRDRLPGAGPIASSAFSRVRRRARTLKQRVAANALESWRATADPAIRST